MESPARGGGRRVRRGSTRDRVGGVPAPTRWMPPGPRPSAPAALVAASGWVRAGQGLPFPSGGGGRRSLRSRAPPPHGEPPSPEAANLRPHLLQQDFPTLLEVPRCGTSWDAGLPPARGPGVHRVPFLRFLQSGVLQGAQPKESGTSTPFLPVRRRLCQGSACSLPCSDEQRIAYNLC